MHTKAMAAALTTVATPAAASSAVVNTANISLAFYTLLVLCTSVVKKKTPSMEGRAAAAAGCLPMRESQPRLRREARNYCRIG
jgi:hypothetical protein